MAQHLADQFYRDAFAQGTASQPCGEDCVSASAAAQRAAKWRSRMLLPSITLPMALVKTRPVSLQTTPAIRRMSRSCFSLRCSTRTMRQSPRRADAVPRFSMGARKAFGRTRGAPLGLPAGASCTASRHYGCPVRWRAPATTQSKSRETSPVPLSRPGTERTRSHDLLKRGVFKRHR